MINSTNHKSMMPCFLRGFVLIMLSTIAFGGLGNLPTAGAFDNVITVVDDGGDNVQSDGSNDVPGQKDLTKLGVDDTHSGELYVTWNFDETTGFSGNNTGDACVLLDTNENGLPNFALCVTIIEDANMVLTQLWNDENGDGIKDPDEPFVSPALYSCTEAGGASPDKCQGPILINENLAGDPNPSLLDSICTISANEEDDPFLPGDPGTTGKGPGDDYPFDTKAVCTLQFSDIPDQDQGGNPTDDPTLLNVCSFPSQNPNSSPSDCVITPGSAFLTIVKAADPNDGTQFDFTLNPAATNGETSFTIFGSGSKNLIPVNPGSPNPITYSITETVPEMWQLDGATCVTNGTPTGTFNDTDAVEEIAFSSGQTTTCTFENSIARQPLGLLTLLKDVNGGSADSSAWTLSVQLNEGSDERCAEAGFSGNDTGSGVSDNVSLSDDNVTCTYTLAESGGPASYVAGDWTCGDDATVDGDQLVVTADGASCTITNNFAELSIDKPAPTNADNDGSGDVSEGDVLTYTITATNTGAANLTNVVVTDNLITRTGGTTPCALVLPNGTCTLIGTYIVTAADVTAGKIENLGTADSDQTDPVTDPEEVLVPSPSLTVDKPAPTNADNDGSGDVSEGDVLTYTITATNNGTANLTNVVVSDSLITRTGGTTPCALVLPNNTCTLIGTYIVTAADVTAGKIENLGTADSDQTDPVEDPETVPVPTPSLTIEKTVVLAGEDCPGVDPLNLLANLDNSPIAVQYCYKVTNDGTANLTNIVVTDDPNGAIGTIGSLEPSEMETLQSGVVSLTGTGFFDNVGIADSDQTGPEDDPARVNVAVGCTLTQGYWKTHAVGSSGDLGRAPEDQRWFTALGDADGDNTEEGGDEKFFRINKTYYEVLTTPTKRNPYYSLGRQYIAAVLNEAVNSGRTLPAGVADALNAAKTLFETYKPKDLRGNKTLKRQFKALIGILTDFNQGELAGFPHCDDLENFGG